MNRRHFIQLGGGLFTSLVMPLGFIQAQSFATPVSAENVTLFLQVSEFITDKSDLKLILAQRALSNLWIDDSEFMDKLRELHATISQSGFPNATTFSKSLLMQNPQIADTVKKITKAWYLGYTGTPVSHRDKDNTQFVTYTDALMYRPTSDATIIPSYSKEKLNYWVNPPSYMRHSS